MLQIVKKENSSRKYVIMFLVILEIWLGITIIKM